MKSIIFYYRGIYFSLLQTFILNSNTKIKYKLKDKNLGQTSRWEAKVMAKENNVKIIGHKLGFRATE